MGKNAASLIAFILFLGARISSFAGEAEVTASDAEMRKIIIGTWIIDERGEDRGVKIMETGFITFNTNGSYMAQATQNNKENKSFLMKWEGKWQIEASWLVTPTTTTSGFEEDLHPRYFIPKCKIIHVDGNKLIYQHSWSHTNNLPFFQRR